MATPIADIVETMLLAGVPTASVVKHIRTLEENFHRTIPVDQVAEKRRAWDRARKQRRSTSTGNPPDPDRPSMSARRSEGGNPVETAGAPSTGIPPDPPEFHRNGQATEIVEEKHETPTIYLSSLTSSEVPSEVQQGKEELVEGRKNGAPRYTSSFETWWKLYPRTPNMSKKEAFAAWQRLDDDDRRKAVVAIPLYIAFLKSKPDHPVVHACRFLSQRRFDGFEAPKLEPDAVEAGFYAADGSDELAAWDEEWIKTKGKHAPRDRNFGWRFPTRWPPGHGGIDGATRPTAKLHRNGSGQAKDPPAANGHGAQGGPADVETFGGAEDGSFGGPGSATPLRGARGFSIE